MSIEVNAALVPRHYRVDMTLTPDGMYRLVVGLRRLVAEYDVGEELEQLLEACENVHVGDLPTPPSAPVDGDDTAATA